MRSFDLRYWFYGFSERWGTLLEVDGTISNFHLGYTLLSMESLGNCSERVSLRKTKQSRMHPPLAADRSGMIRRWQDARTSYPAIQAFVTEGGTEHGGGTKESYSGDRNLASKSLRSRRLQICSLSDVSLNNFAAPAVLAISHLVNYDA
jgi:hypothetical protein